VIVAVVVVVAVAAVAAAIVHSIYAAKNTIGERSTFVVE